MTIENALFNGNTNYKATGNNAFYITRSVMINNVTDSNVPVHVYVTNSIFTNINASTDGAVFYLENTHLSCVSCVFTSNIAYDSAGGTISAKNSRLIISDSDFEDNSAA